MTTITSRPRPRPRPTCPAPSGSCVPPATSRARSRPRSATTCSPGCAPATTAFPGIVGFDDTVLPELERALLAGHDLVLLGERGQGKTRLIRTLVGAARRVDARSSPAARSTTTRSRPITRALPAPARRARRRRCRSPGCTASERYGEKLATPDTSVGDLIGDVDPIKVAEGRTLGDPETDPLRPGAAHQPRHLRRQRAARPGRADPGVAAQRARGARHPGPRLRAAAAARPAARRQREPGGLHQPRPDHHAAQGPVRRRDPHALPAAPDRRGRR